MALFSTAFIPLNWGLGQLHVAEGKNDGIFFLSALSFAWKVSLLKVMLVAGICVWLFSRAETNTLFVVAICGVPAAFHDIVGIHRAECERTGNFRANFFNALLTIVVALGIGIPMAIYGCGVYALAIPAPVLMVLQMFFYRQQTKLPLFNGLASNHNRSLLSKGFAMWVIGACDVASARLDKIFIGHFSGDFALGNYTRAFNYAPLSHQILSSLVGNPTVSAIGHCRSQKDKRALIFKTGSILAIAGILNWSLILLAAPWAVPFAFGEQWRASVPFFQAFAGLSLALGLNGLFSAVLVSLRLYGTLAAVRATVNVLTLGIIFLVVAKGNTLFAPALFVGGLFVQGLILAGIAFFFLRRNPESQSI